MAPSKMANPTLDYFLKYKHGTRETGLLMDQNTPKLGAMGSVSWIDILVPSVFMVLFI